MSVISYFKKKILDLKLKGHAEDNCMFTSTTPNLTHTKGDQTTGEKNCQNFQKIAPKVAKSKNAKISITKLNLKTQNIHIKPLLKP